MNAPYCKLPGHDQRCAYIPADRTDIRKTFEQFEPIRVCEIEQEEIEYQRLIEEAEYNYDILRGR